MLRRILVRPPGLRPPHNNSNMSNLFRRLVPNIFRPLATDVPSPQKKTQSSNNTTLSDTITTTSAPLSTPMEWLLTLMGYYGAESTRIRDSQALFRTCLERATLPTWARCTSLTTTEFMPSHQLLIVHIWVLNKKLLNEGVEGKKMQKELFETLWENTERRIRAAGVYEMRVSRQLMEVQKVSFGALVAYDRGFKNITDNNEELCAALFRNLFASKPPSNVEVVAVASWMRNEVARLLKKPLHEIVKDGPQWTLPSGFIITQEDIKQEEVQGQRGLWRRAMSIEGKTYFWNVKTRESRWEKPVEDD